MNDPYKATPAPWYYVTGAVWTTPQGPDDGGKCIAMRGSTKPTEPDLSPTAKDRNMRLCAKAPELRDALRALAATARTFRNVPKDEQEWTLLDEEALTAAFAVLNSLED